MTQNETKFYLLGQKHSLKNVKNSLDHLEKHWGINKKSIEDLLDNLIEGIQESIKDNEE